MTEQKNQIIHMGGWNGRENEWKNKRRKKEKMNKLTERTKKTKEKWKMGEKR